MHMHAHKLVMYVNARLNTRSIHVPFFLQEGLREKEDAAKKEMEVSFLHIAKTSMCTHIYVRTHAYTHTLRHERW